MLLPDVERDGDKDEQRDKHKGMEKSKINLQAMYIYI